MLEVKAYHLKPTKLIPNSPYPLLHYPSFFSPNSSSDVDTTQVYDLYTKNGWPPQWIYRYGPTQTSHYHSRAHECMTVLSGTAKIRFGVSDHDSEEQQASRGVTLQAKAGDVFILPAGTAHKTFDVRPEAEFKLLTPGDGHGIEASDKRAALAATALDGFTMLGAYPSDSEWDFAVGGEDEGKFEEVWRVAKPESDPVFGSDNKGICGSWNDVTI